MSKKLPQRVKDNVEKCTEAALAAVEVYNKPGKRFRTAQYLVLIVIAWTALFHAIFYKTGKRPWYRRRSSGSGNAIRYEKIDGDPKHWDLSKCINEYYGSNNPAERKNLEFLIGLRNKIEHRHLPELDASLYGECQAALQNLEDLLVQEFGQKYALLDQLAVSLQFSRSTPSEKRKAAQTLATTSAKKVSDYIEKFRGNLPSAVLSSMKYSFSVFLVPKVANRENAADVAVEFFRVDEKSEEELKRLERLNVLIKEKHIPIANLNLYKAGKVVPKVNEAIPHRFTMNTHTDAWKYFKVRPIYGSKKPEQTVSKYCVYDSPHKDYLYTQAWIDKLKVTFSDPIKYEQITGRKPT